MKPNNSGNSNINLNFTTLSAQLTEFIYQDLKRYTDFIYFKVKSDVSYGLGIQSLCSAKS